MLIKSKEAREYVRHVIRTVHPSSRLGLGSKDCPVKISGTIFYRNKFLADLSVELVQDALQEAGVISNDRYVCHVDVKKGHDKGRPRAELTIEEVPEFRW